MKVRIGFGLGTQTRANEPGTVRRAGRRARGPALRLAVALGAAHRRRARSVGRPVVRCGADVATEARHAVLVLPGRNPVVLAKELASLDRLSSGTAAAGGRSRRAGPGGAPGVRHRAHRTSRLVRRGDHAHALAVVRRRGDPRRRTLRRRVGAAPARAGAAADRALARRSGAVRAPQRPAGSATAGCRRSRRRPMSLAGWELINDHRGRARTLDRPRAPRGAHPLRRARAARTRWRPSCRSNAPTSRSSPSCPSGPTRSGA